MVLVLECHAIILICFFIYNTVIIHYVCLLILIQIVQYLPSLIFNYQYEIYYEILFMFLPLKKALSYLFVLRHYFIQNLYLCENEVLYFVAGGKTVWKTFKNLNPFSRYFINSIHILFAILIIWKFIISNCNFSDFFNNFTKNKKPFKYLLRICELIEYVSFIYLIWWRNERIRMVFYYLIDLLKNNFEISPCVFE